MAKSDEFLQQARRLGGLHFCPQTAEAWTEIARILMRFCKTSEHASRVIDRFLEPGANEQCPTPGEVAQVAKSVPADAKLDRPELQEPCAECQAYQGAWKWSEEKHGLERCGCARGRRLSQLDAQRSKSEARKPAETLTHAGDWAKKAAGDRE